jgi:hypothetical protein
MHGRILQVASCSRAARSYQGGGQTANEIALGVEFMSALTIKTKN